MAYEDLLKSVEESAHMKEQELRSRAAAEIEEVKSRARKRAEELRRAQLDETDRSAASERNKLLYETRTESKEQLIRVREAAFEKAFSAAREQLQGLRSDPKYPEIFNRLLKEAAEAMGGGAFVIHIDPRDKALAGPALALLGMTPEVKTDLTTAGGVVASLPDNSVVVSNTVEARLDRARELRRREIHSILSGA